MRVQLSSIIRFRLFYRESGILCFTPLLPNRSGDRKDRAGKKTARDRPRQE
jgi:hypothetical protein